MTDSNHTIRCLQTSCKDIEVFTTNRIMQFEKVNVVLWQIHMEEIIHWSTTLEATEFPKS
jgi:hypothetical protein